MKLIRKWVQKSLDRLGYKVSRTSGFAQDPFMAQHEILRRLDRSNPVIFDVGANKGQTATKYRALFPGALIYCFEPFPETIAVLEEKFADDDRIHISPLAVSKEKGESRFYVNERNATNSLFPRPNSNRRYYPKSAGPKDTIVVETVSLDEFILANSVTKIDVLKFDIQGGELNALRGAEKHLSTGATPLIYTEAMFVPHYEGAPLLHDIWSYLSNFGYSPFDIYGLVHAKNGQLRYGDVLFISSDARKSVIDMFEDEP